MFKIHYSTYIFFMISSLTASFIPCIIISTLIVIHELGHYLIAKLLKVEVDKIYLYPLGGISKFNLELNSNPIYEFIILVSGPLYQFIAYFILISLLPKYVEIIEMYHYQILFFNLLPVYPLDGGKLLNIVLSYNVPYKKSLIYSIIISYLTIFIIFIKNINNIKFNIIVMLIFLFYKITKEKNKISMYYEKFILERYLKRYNFKHTKIISNIDNFYRNKHHIIKEKDKYYEENDFLSKKYKFFSKIC